MIAHAQALLLPLPILLWHALCSLFVPGLLPPCQAFSDYQLQQMTSNFIDQFGFKEDEFTEQEENVE